MKKLLLVFINLVICLSFTIDCIIAASVNKRPHPNIKYSSELTNRRRENVWLTCDSEIYCEGEVLHDVQLMRLFHDSKIFVDFKLRFPEKEITEKYKDLKQKEHGLVSRAKLKQFVEDNFERGNELEQWVPNDWTREPSVLQKVKDPRYKKWVYYLNTMWRVLSRRVKEEVLLKPEMYSLIYVPNGFVIPGGRFTELYYWDTYWIINGLLLCDMRDTVRGVIENLIHLVKLFGHVPNGSRIYYITRSQPPLLIQMLQTYYKATDDWEFVQENISYMDDEFNYWWENHMITIAKDGGLYKLARYFSYHPTPRPESYREDYLIAHEMKEIESKEDFYIKIRSGAETGWDFSSRWFVKNKRNEGNLSDIATPQIVPVDLNAWLQLNAVILNEWYTKLGDTAKADEYAKRAQHLLDGITKVLWREELGAWFDFDSVNKVTREYFYASNLTPLSTFSYPKSWNRNDLSKKVIKYIHANNIDQYVGGVPTSLEETGEQWDFPNAWAPLQQVMVDGLDKLGTPESKEEAFRLANKWLQSNYRGYTEAHTMYEKYDVLRPGETGEGGEYVPQTGFGWTNGVILEFLDKYGETAEFSEKDEKQVGFEHGLPREKKESDSDRLSVNLENVVLDS